MEEKLAEVRSVIDQIGLFENVSVFYLVAKRAFDILGSLLGIIILSPVFLITVISIKLNSSGGVFFNQERNGYKGKVFKMYKFRSMIVNADELIDSIESRNEISGHMFKIKEDPRVTSVGKIIRKTSIDELPQLFNILKGNMSIVGPRPPIPREVFDVAVDLRKDSKTFGMWKGVYLSSINRMQFYIPPGFAHGFLVVSDTAEFAYKCTEYYHPEDEYGILWNDSDIGIEWPLKDILPCLSAKDAGWDTIKEYFTEKR